MLVFLSHAIAFSSLFVASTFDILSDKGDVPDIASVVPIVAGLALHLAASMPELSLSAFAAAFAAGTPIYWALSIGAAFSLIGWSMYFLGMWGGADAFAMSVLGFAAPYSLAGPGISHAVNLFMNILIIGFFYNLGFALYKAAQAKQVWVNTARDIKNDWKRISLELAMITALSYIASIGGLNGYFYFIGFTSLVFLYRFLQNVQHDLMAETVPVSELEGGEVLEEKLDLGEQTTKPFFGRKVEGVRKSLGLDNGSYMGRFLLGIEESLDSKVAGITEDQIEELETREIEEVTVKEGVRFVLVFPAALLVTDLFTGGLTWLMLVFN